MSFSFIYSAAFYLILLVSFNTALHLVRGGFRCRMYFVYANFSYNIAISMSNEENGQFTPSNGMPIWHTEYATLLLLLNVDKCARKNFTF